jgi:hypothetical protein
MREHVAPVSPLTTDFMPLPRFARTHPASAAHGAAEVLFRE